MSAEEFWKNDPQLFVSYRTSFINKKQREKEELDYKCWLQGLYIHDGNGKLILSLKQFIGNIVASMFKSHKDTTPIDTYPTKPYEQSYKEKQRKKELEMKQLNYQTFHNDLIYYGTLKQQYMNKLKQKGV